MDDSDNSVQPELSSDEEWKERVKAENAAADEKLSSGSGGNSSAVADEPEQAESSDSKPETIDEENQPQRSFPQAEFSTLVGMLSAQAMVSLGMIPNPVAGKSEVQLETVKHLIDLLGVLEEKTKGNLSASESGSLETTAVLLKFKPPINAKSKAGQTALDIAEQEKFEKISKLLKDFAKKSE